MGQEQEVWLTKVKVPWQAWYGDIEKDLSLPEGWHVSVAAMNDGEPIDHRRCEQVLHSPTGTPPLEDLAKKAQRASIVVEDITRPCPTAQILPSVLASLKRGGLGHEQVRIIVGTGAHTFMHRAELLKKIGPDILENVVVSQHHPYENLAYLGESRRGTPIYINRHFLESDLRIAVGGITPHSFTGFSGGAKLVAVGIAGMDTIHANHKRAVAGEAGGVGNVAGNECRADMEEIAERAGLAFIVAGVVNSRRQLAGVFAGHMIQAHRAAAEFARRVYATPLPPPADIGIFNAYPKDIDLVQAINAFRAVDNQIDKVVRPGGTVVIASACPEGAGFHLWAGPGGRHDLVYDQYRDFGGYQVMIYSPHLSYLEAKPTYPDNTLVFKSWQETIEELTRQHGMAASVTVFPCASLQMPA